MLFLISSGAYTGLKHTHTLLAFLFVGFFLYKAILLLTGNEAALDKVRSKKALKIVFDMVLPTLLITLGFTMAFSAGAWPAWLILKLICALSAIPMGIYAMQKKSRVMTMATLILLLSVVIIAYTN